MRNSKINLYSGVNLTIGDNNTFYFESVEKQRQYFARRNVLTVDGAPYIRNNRTYIRVPYTMAQVYRVNYCSYINPNYENKLTYCFVVARTYINDNVTELEIAEDIHQTWLFDYAVMPSIVERMHTPTDEIGDNLTADNFDFGEYKTVEKFEGLGLADSVVCIMVECSFNAYTWADDSDTWGDKTIPQLYNRNGIYSATQIVAFPVRIRNNDGSYSYAGADSAFLKFMQHVNNGDSGVTVNDILSMWLYPMIFTVANSKTIVRDYDTDERFRKIYDVGGILQGSNVTVAHRPSKLDGYTPKNKKLLTFPYTQLMAFNNNGSATTYRFEYFKNPENVNMSIYGTTTSESKIRITPYNYKGLEGSNNADFAEALDSAPYPIVSYLGDAYNIWFAQNRNTIQNQWDALELSAVTGIASSALDNIGGVLAPQNVASEDGGQMTNVSLGGGMLSSAMSSVMQAKALIAQHQDARLAPNTAKGVQSQGIAYQSGKTFTFYSKTIDAQHAKRIDDFFTMYGYPINEITNINRKTRKSFTFIKTLDAHIQSVTMPEDQRRFIQQSFNNGVRFWCNTDRIGDYTVDNSVL